MDLGRITDKEIQFNIMMSLMKIEGHLSELIIDTADVDFLNGGEINDLTRPD